MIEMIAIALAFGGLAFTLASLRQAREKIEELESDIDAVEGHNRTLQEQRDTLKSTLGEATVELESTKKRLETAEGEKQEIERQRAGLAETAARLEKVRAELEGEVARLRREQESLERRVIDFQGQWSHQLTTIEAEISTVVRQLGEFRKGTQLPIARDPSAPGSGAAPGSNPAELGPRLAGARPRPVSAEPASVDPAAARRVP